MGRPRIVVPPELIEEYLDGKTISEVAKRIGCTRETANRALLRQGIRSQKVGQTSDRWKNVVREYFYQGKSTSAIASEYGITRQRVEAILRRTRERLGLTRVGWLSVVPCSGCGDLVAASRISPPAYCYRCWLQLPPAIQAEGSTREEHDAQ